ncbi:MAG: acetoin dehydrogenase dihydrolipoyllysine-residue acetyltransferase subunit [Rhodospirillales bacterium]|nr:acetoin dehydrogenase dihydrolipoyllysine-residue acetyltransferase subunit [Rhodospirillales bacterium]
MTDAIKPIGMPKWGLAMTEGRVNAWLVPDGATIKQGDEILEIETSKITNVFESPVSGILRRKVAGEGDTLPVGALLGVVADADTADADLDAFVAQFQLQAAEQASEAAAPEPVMVPAGNWTARVLRMGPDEAAESAAPVVMIHGFGGDLLSWQLNQPDLAADRAVYAIDLPGHGGSTKALDGDGSVAWLADAVRGAMAALQITRAHLVGHSLGGAVALQMALDEPDRIASVTLVCAAGLGREVNADYIEGFIRADRRKEMKAVVEALFADPSLVSRDMVEDLLKYKRLDGVLAALRRIADAAFADGQQRTVLADRLPDLAVPVQAIWGAQDRIVPPAHAAAVAEARRHVLPGAGHMVHMERPTEVNRLIAAFVAVASD